MSGKGIPGFLAIRVIDNNTGAEIVRELPHLGSKWGVRALQPGQAGSTMIGDATIDLPGPGMPGFNENADLFRSLKPGMRVEAYIGGRALFGAGTTPITGSLSSTTFSGTIQPPISKPGQGPWQLSVKTGPWMLAQTQTLPGEKIHNGGALVTPFTLFSNWLGGREVLWADDFANWFGASAPGAPAASNYTNTGAWSATGADPYFGGPAVFQTTAGSEFNLTTTTTWGSSTPASGPWATSVIAAQGVMIAGTPGAGNTASNIGVWAFADSTGQNGLLADVLMLPQSVAGWYSITARIHTRVGGVFTQLASKSNVMTNVTSPLEFRIEMVLRQEPPDPTLNSPGVGFFVAEVIFNGQATGCKAGYVNVGPGRTGLRSFIAVGGSPGVYVNRLTFDSRTSGSGAGDAWGTDRYQQGSVNTGGAVPSSPITASGQSNLDVIAMLANVAGFYCRVEPGTGHKDDAFDFGGVGSPNPGTDRSNRIRLEEGVNIDAQGSQVATIQEIFGTGVKLAGIPGSDSGGIMTFDAIGKPGDAVLVGSYAEMGLPNFTLLSRFARRLQARRADPLQAQVINVVRDSAWVGINAGQGPRELDIVTVNYPTLGIYNEKLIIIGFDFVEGSGNQVVYFSGLPYGINSDVAARYRQPIDWVTATYTRR